ncbi:DUF2809 domain-containing protein [Paenibacillus doosanensis]|uniref:ribosomal maturation YjgA family protein n=1 Tax=Paenibacillus doosanensis TaxID=1229154 RepID=UPI00217FAD7D|nr:DUF2809 domain-containing protein [Paenibacillus doosanensis]MCS7464140.1 DUF2809 domain-containing protein [Paenibacillus doosanensis]
MRIRIQYFVAVVITIILGLSSRRFADRIPELIAEHAGDMLWAAMVYFGFRFVFVRRGFILAAVLSIVFSYAVEFSQLYQAAWINRLRDTVLGALVLGKGFLPADLLRYLLGIAIACGMDACWPRRKR